MKTVMAIDVISNRLFHLHTQNTSYIFDLTSRGLLRHLYYGKRINRTEDFLMTAEAAESNLHSSADRSMEEISFFGTLRFNETSVKLRFFDGTADFRGCAAGHIVNDNKLIVTLRDIYYPLTVELHYEVFEDTDIIKRFTRVVNNGKEDIVFERIYSSEFGIPENDLNIINFGGTWAAEFQRKSDSLCGGKKVYENLRGTTGHVVNPCFIVHKNADENSGSVYFGCLAYSGNYKITAEATPYEYTKILMGISDTDFSKTLAASESFDTPAAYIGYTENGFADMSLKMHSFCRKYIMPQGLAETPLKVLYNSWCATGFNVTCEEQKQLAEKAAALGAEMFVVDDGWFGVRNNDRQGLGDWYADRTKFPNDISELIEHVHNLGMSFGLWVEPEMVNEDSEFFRSHPELIYRFPNRTPITARHQLVLDLTREEVAEFIIDTLDRLLTDYNIEYIKWDMNRYISETVTENPKEMWDKHIRNLYHIVDEIRRRHPNVEFEACASGGGADIPEWGLGIWYRNVSSSGDKDWLAMAKKFKEQDIPCSVFGLEPGWQSKAYSCSYVWSPERAANHKEFLKQMKDMGYRVNMWEHAFVHPSSPIYDSIEKFSGDYDVWKGLVPDFSMPETRKAFTDYHKKNIVDEGVSGFKLDECDGSDFTNGWSFPNSAEFPSGLDGEQMHSLIGILYQQTINSMFKEPSMHQVRNSHALASPYPFVLYSDLYGHKDYIRGMANMGFSGLLWMPEVRIADSVKDLIRRIQTVILSPLAQIDAWYIPNPPWEQINRAKNNAGEIMENHEEVTNMCRELFKFRYKLVPYLKEAFDRYRDEGIPPFRALVVDYPKDAETYNIEDQYMMGDKYMAAPLTAESDTRRFYIPETGWKHYKTGEVYEKGWHEKTFELMELPLFVKS